MLSPGIFSGHGWLTMPAPLRPVAPDASIRSLEERDALIIDHQWVSMAVAEKLYRTSALCRRLGEIDDLVSVGNIALVQAAERWRSDHPKKAKFSSYAYKKIKFYLLRQARDAGIIRVPEAVNATIMRGRGRPVTEDRRQAALTAWNCRQLPRHLTLFGEHEPPSPAEELLHQVLAELQPHERQLLEQRYGLGGTPIRQHKEIAADEGVVTTTINERVRSLCRRLRVRLAEALDADYEQSRAA